MSCFEEQNIIWRWLVNMSIHADEKYQQHGSAGMHESRRLWKQL